MNNFKDFTNLYSLSKTLRFELKPLGETLENIKKGNLLSKDEKRLADYQIAKNAIDSFHRLHIEQALAEVDFGDGTIENRIEEFEALYLKKSKEEKELKRFDDLQKILRSWLADSLQGKEKKDKKKNIQKQEKIKERFSILFKKDLFDNKEFISLAEEKGYDEIILSFKGFTTYFKGFHKNRENMYSAEKESTAIAYRIIHENLPKFLENKQSFVKIKNALGKVKLKEFEANFKDILGKYKLDKVFSIQYFQNVLNQSGIDAYNMIIGGKPAKEGVKKVQGLNELINLTRQQNPELKIPSLKILYKQILSEADDNSFKMEAFEKDIDLIEALSDFWNIVIVKYKDSSDKTKNLLKVVESLFRKITRYSDKNLSGIYIENKNLTNLSQQVFGDWSLLIKALSELFDVVNKDKPQNKALEKEKKKFLKSDYFSIKELEEAFTIYSNLHQSEFEDFSKNPIQQYFSEIKIKIQEKKKIEWFYLPDEISSTFQGIESILSKDREDKKNLHQKKRKVEKIKSFLDSLKSLQGFIKLLHLSVPVEEKNYEFYDELDKIHEALFPLNSLYNKTRNYLTRKPYSEEKFKLNFESPTLLNGWDKNKETAKEC